LFSAGLSQYPQDGTTIAQFLQVANRPLLTDSRVKTSKIFDRFKLLFSAKLLQKAKYEQGTRSYFVDIDQAPVTAA
jgi:hypothetical protein